MRDIASDNNESKNSRQCAQTWHYKRYKEFETTLRNASAEWFYKKGYKLHPKMRYCLAAHDNWAQNIICDDVVGYIKNGQQRHSSKEAFPLHKYLHHGLSSQAMVFNLIGPLIVRKDLEPLKTAMERGGIRWPVGKVYAGFEYMDRDVFNEDAGQPTSIDLVIEGRETSLFIEAKLVEREFGGCSVFSGGDCEGQNPARGFEDCYLHHIKRKYWCKMKEFGFLSSAIASGAICPFACYYQFFREVLFALSKKGKFILLYDERNPSFIRTDNGNSYQRGLWPFLKEAVPAQHQSNIGSISIQQVVRSIAESSRHDDWIIEFKNKYGIA